MYQIIYLMRKLLFGLVSLIMITASAQSTSAAKEAVRQATDTQIEQYITQAKAQGYSLSTVENLLRSQGATYQDLARLSALWGGVGEASSEAIMDEEAIGTDFGLSAKSVDAPAQTRAARFGSSFFNRAKLTETPELYIATPDDYQLGPGDELSIQLFGGSEEMYSVQISREGYIKVPRLAPVYLSGLSVGQAKTRIKNAFSQIYTGLNVPNDDPSRVDLMVSLRSARSVVINISGNVQVPGTYTISAFSSVLNALYAAGGPNEVGSYRNIKIIRNGKLLQSIDLYDFFLNGSLPSLYLKDQDIIQVPALQKEVELKGGFKTTGFFELKESETLKELLAISGGFMSNAYKERVLVNRISGYKRETLAHHLNNSTSFALEDGDVITSNLINDVVENGVSIEGAVYLPGLYSLSIVSTVGELLEASKGLTKEAFSGQATLFRRSYEVENQARTIDLNSASDLNITLKGGDRLYIPSALDVFNSGTISVIGEVNSPGTFEFKEGMTLYDALVLADGFSSQADRTSVAVYFSSIYDRELFTQTDFYQVSDELKTQYPVQLEANSLIVVKKRYDLREVERVTLNGLVVNPGVYAIKSNTYRLYDLLEDSGGFIEDAFLNGISITRQVESKEQINRVISDISEGEAFTKVLNESIVMGINGEKLMQTKGLDLNLNPILLDGDVINIPKQDNTITVIGEVQQTSKIVFNNNISVVESVKRAGDFNQYAKKSAVYVIYKNGSVKSRKRILGIFRSDPKLEPGVTIVVPKKIARENRTSITEIVGITSSLATVALLIRQLGL